jgi:hypothetical protein
VEGRKKKKSGITIMIGPSNGGGYNEIDFLN